MVNYREILRLNSLKYTQRQIAASVHSSRNTVSDVIKLASEARLDWPLDDSHTNEVLYALLYPSRLEAINPRREPDYSYIHKELAKPGVNLTLLWTEYCAECHTNGLCHICILSFVISIATGHILQKQPCGLTTNLAM